MLVYWLPLIVGGALLAIGATALGSYQQSWDLLHWIFNTVEPGFYYRDPQVISMYQVTQFTRKLAHVVSYAGLTILVLRICQGGRPRLRRRSLGVAVLFSVAFMGLDVYVRKAFGGGIRHVRWEQFYLNGVGVLCVVLGTLAHFGIKALERRILELEEENGSDINHAVTNDAVCTGSDSHAREEDHSSGRDDSLGERS